jgi:uncharacterized membrane-anchored protein YhcB (DUF1043 family)
MAKTTSTDEQLRKLRKELRAKRTALEFAEGYRKQLIERHAQELAQLRAQLADKSDQLLPAKHALLKELSYLVNATSKAVRTTMWSLAPEKRRGW